MYNPIDKQEMKMRLYDLVNNQGMTLNMARRHIGISIGTASKWMSEIEKNDDLSPESSRLGRKPKVALTSEETAILRRSMLTRNSLPLAVEDLLQSPACTTATHSVLQGILDTARLERKRPYFPPSLRKAAHVTPESKALFRGGKRVEDFQLVRPRGEFIINADGRRVELEPNMIWESDDMSVNTPFKWVDPDSGEWLTGRQTLITGDRYSRAFLGVTPIGRSRDAYRVEDIADHILHCVETHGMPYIWRIERGVWDNQFIWGIKTRGGKTWGGLCDIIHIEQTWTSGGKGFIEGSFNQLQARLAHESLDIGRTRGEFAGAARIMRQAQAGMDKALAHLWTIEECAEAMSRAMEKANNAQKTMEAKGTPRMSPNELYGDFARRPLADKDRWRFCPVKRELTVRRNAIKCKVAHYSHPFYFQINGDHSPVFLEQGTPVLVAFHPGRPERGAYIFNGMETSDSRNVKRIPWGSYLMTAPLIELAPQVNLDPFAVRDGRKKEANAAMRAEYRAIIPNGGHPNHLRQFSESRDHLGQAMRTQVGGASEGESAHTPVTDRKRPEKKYKLKPRKTSVEDAKRALGL